MRHGDVGRKRQVYAALSQRCGADRLPALYHALLLQCLTAHLCPGDEVAEAGSFYGRLTLPLAAAVGAQGRVWAYEPVAESLRQLRLRAAQAGLGAVIQAEAWALADIAGATLLHTVPAAPGRACLRPPEIEPDRAASLSILPQEVEARRLEQLLAERPLRMLVLDIEGGELHALRGATAVLRMARPMVFLRNSRFRAAAGFGYTPPEFFAVFRQQGYVLANILGFGFAEEDWSTPGQPGWYVALPEETPALQGSLCGVADAVLERHGLLEVVC